MSRKQFKSIVNTAARVLGRAQAKAKFGSRKQFVRVPGAFIDKKTATLFALV